MQTKKLLTLCLVHTPTHILLGLKKHGFGQGRWNGFGGKLAPNETIENATKRELQEECGLIAHSIVKRGELQFEFSAKGGSAPGGEFQNNPEVLEVHIFDVPQFSGEPKESDEMKPQWFTLDKIPFENMWPDDRHWLPLFLAGKNFTGRFYFRDSNTLLRYEIKEG